jgi:hypothetical protein
MATEDDACIGYRACDDLDDWKMAALARSVRSLRGEIRPVPTATELVSVKHPKVGDRADMDNEDIGEKSCVEGRMFRHRL